jgi:hypothetical protein
VLCFEVTEGKTKSAARIIPCHSLITPLVLSLREKPHNGFLFYRASIIDRADGSAQRGIHSVLRGLNVRHWGSGIREGFSLVTSPGGPNFGQGRVGRVS